MMDRRPAFAPFVLLVLAVVLTVASQAVYFDEVIAKGAGWMYLYGFSSFLYSPSVVTLGIVRLCAGDLLRLGGMVGIGLVLLARRPVRPVRTTLACAALALVEVDRFLLAFPEQARTTNWFHFGLTHGLLLDSLQAGFGLLVAGLLFALLPERIPVRWARALVPVLAASAALQVWIALADDRSMSVLRLMSITWASHHYEILLSSLLLSIGAFLFDAALLLFALRALHRGSFRTSQQFSPPPVE